MWVGSALGNVWVQFWRRFLGWRDLGLKVTTFTIWLQKIPWYVTTIPQKKPNSAVKTINRLIMPISIHAVKGAEPSFLGLSVSLPLHMPMQIGCQLDQTDDQPERNPTLIEIPLQTDYLPSGATPWPIWLNGCTNAGANIREAAGMGCQERETAPVSSSTDTDWVRLTAKMHFL